MQRRLIEEISSMEDDTPEDVQYLEHDDTLDSNHTHADPYKE